MNGDPTPTRARSPRGGKPNWRTRRGWIRLICAPVSARARRAQASLRTVITGRERGRKDAHARGMCHHVRMWCRVFAVGKQRQDTAVSIRTPELLEGISHRIGRGRNESGAHRLSGFILRCHFEEQPGIDKLLFPLVGRSFLLAGIESQRGILAYLYLLRRHYLLLCVRPL